MENYSMIKQYKLFGRYFCDNCGHWFKTGCFLPGEKDDPEAVLLYDDICPKCGALVGEWYQCFSWWKENRKLNKIEKLRKDTWHFLSEKDSLVEFRYSKFVGTLTVWAPHSYGHLKWKRLGELLVGYRGGIVYMVEMENADYLIPNIHKMNLQDIQDELIKYILNLKIGG